MTPRNAPTAEDANWPRRPQNLGSREALAGYLDHYAEWLSSQMAPSVDRAARQFREGAVNFVELIKFCAGKVHAAAPLNHKTDAIDNGFSTMSQWFGAQGWSAELASSEAVNFLATPLSSMPASRIGESGVVSAIVARVAPLHVAESVVRQNAMKQLVAHGRLLPGATRKMLSRDNLKSGVGQVATREALVRGIGSLEDYVKSISYPPVEAMQRAWLTSVWVARRGKLLADASLEDPDVRRETQEWVSTFEAIHPWLARPAMEAAARMPAQTPNDAAWIAYVDSQLAAIETSVMTKSAPPRVRAYFLKTDSEEIVAEAYRITCQWLRHKPALPDDQRHPDFWREGWNSSLRTARSNFWGDFKKQKELTSLSREDAVATPDHVDSAASKLTELHLHLGQLFLRRVDEGGLGVASARSGLVAVVLTCQREGRQCHGDSLAGWLERVVRHSSAEELADEVLYHLASTPREFLAIGELFGDEPSALLKRLADFDDDRGLDDEGPRGETW